MRTIKCRRNYSSLAELLLYVKISKLTSRFFFSNIPARGAPWYIFVVSLVKFIIAGAIIVIICFLVGSRRKKSPSGYEQVTSQVGTTTEVNPACTSHSDVKEATTSQEAHEKKIA